MFRRLDRRERIVVTGGAVISALALTLTMIVLPWFDHAVEREQRIRLYAAQLARLEALTAEVQALDSGELRLAAGGRELGGRLLPGATAAVAGSNLQLLLNRLVAGSGLEVQRVDAAGAPSDDGPLQRIPARLTARGDVGGLVELLHRVQVGEPLLVVDQLRVGMGTVAARGPFMLPGQTPAQGQLTISVDLHGYYGGEGSPR